MDRKMEQVRLGYVRIEEMFDRRGRITIDEAIEYLKRLESMHIQDGYENIYLLQHYYPHPYASIWGEVPETDEETDKRLRRESLTKRIEELKKELDILGS